MNDVDDHPLHQQRESAARLGPRQLHLQDPMLGASGSRHLCVQVRFELATVQMPPYPFDRVIVKADDLATGCAAPLGIRAMLHENLHPLLLHVQFNPADEPWLNKPKNLLIKLSITHPCMLT